MNRFFKSKSGSFAVMTAILVIPILATFGLAVDYTKASEIKSGAQNAADAAVLAAASATDSSMNGRKKSPKRCSGPILIRTIWICLGQPN
jgi:Flp pilus assembly protein TadG